MSRPSKRIWPLVTGCSPSTALPIVVLPDPDSPTRPRVSPRAIENETSFTAGAALREYCTTRLRTSSSGVAAPSSPVEQVLIGHRSAPTVTGCPPLLLAAEHLVTADAADAPAPSARGSSGIARQALVPRRTGSGRRTGIRSATNPVRAPAPGSTRGAWCPRSSTPRAGRPPGAPSCTDARAAPARRARTPSRRARPAYITATSSHRSATTPRSWVTSTTDISRSATSPRSSPRISACTVTSSAVVGSSATSRRGEPASARAMATRWAMPPGDLVGVALQHARGVDDADVVEQLRRDPPRLLAVHSAETLDRGLQLPGDREHRVERARWAPAR